jgi:hypothetical protein
MLLDVFLHFLVCNVISVTVTYMEDEYLFDLSGSWVSEHGAMVTLMCAALVSHIFASHTPVAAAAIETISMPAVPACTVAILPTTSLLLPMLVLCGRTQPIHRTMLTTSTLAMLVLVLVMVIGTSTGTLLSCPAISIRGANSLWCLLLV